MKTTAAFCFAEAGCVFMSFILFISGIYGQTKMICTLKGSSVDLSCSAKNSTSINKWYTVNRNGSVYDLNEISAEGNHVTYMSEESQRTLTINDLLESDSNLYCCEDNPKLCWQNAIQLNVSDLQVMVFPATDGQTVTLMCSTSCPLTETPAAYVWYKNSEFLYEDWSPWYQELVSSDESVTYSCAVKGYEDLRAPEVSVDSVTSTYFNVTYAKGRMCSYHQKSENESCSITSPREVQVQMTPVSILSHVTLTCGTSSPFTEAQTAYKWYRNRCTYLESHYLLSRSSSNTSFSCAVKGLEHLHSADVCVTDENCWSVNYINRRICALESSSVDILSQYSHPKNQQPTSAFWYKKQSSGEQEAEKLIESAGRVLYSNHMKNRHLLTINNLKNTDSAKYIFSLTHNEECKWHELPGVTLIVTGLKVKLHPAVVTEGQRVTLTCGTSCPLSGDTIYIWYLNGQALTLPENQTKHLVLDPVSSQHEGNYSCSVRTGKTNISSTEKTLTLLSISGTKTLAAAVGACTALLVTIPLTIFWWIRRKKTSPKPETSQSINELNSSPLYGNISTQQREQDGQHYGRLIFSKKHTEDLYNTLEPLSSN